MAGSRDKLIQEVCKIVLSKIEEKPSVFEKILEKNRGSFFVVRKSLCPKYVFVVDGECFTKQQVKEEILFYLENNLEKIVLEMEEQIEQF